MGISEIEAGNRATGADRESIRRMFARIAPRYDLMNRLLSIGQDQTWRTRAVEDTLSGAPWLEGPSGPLRVLDTCSGTGELALAYARALPGGTRVVACDFTHDMLRRLGPKSGRPGAGGVLAAVTGDSLALPFRTARFHVVSAAFGVRNVAHGCATGVEAGLVAAFREMERVLLPGGRAAILEFSEPSGAVASGLVRFYFRQVLPRVGNTFVPSGDRAYRYLPDSVEGFPTGESFLARMREAGLRPILHRTAMMGLVSLYLAEKSAVPPAPSPSVREGAGHGAR